MVGVMATWGRTDANRETSLSNLILYLILVFSVKLFCKYFQLFLILRLVDFILLRNLHQRSPKFSHPFIFLHDPSSSFFHVFFFFIELNHELFKLWASLFDIDWLSPFVLTVLINFKHDFIKKLLSFRMSLIFPPF